MKTAQIRFNHPFNAAQIRRVVVWLASVSFVATAVLIGVFVAFPASGLVIIAVETALYGGALLFVIPRLRDDQLGRWVLVISGGLWVPIVTMGFFFPDSIPNAIVLAILSFMIMLPFLGGLQRTAALAAVLLVIGLFGVLHFADYTASFEEIPTWVRLAVGAPFLVVDAALVFLVTGFYWKRMTGLLGQARHLSKRLIDVQEQERASISRGLHDEIGQNLTTLKFTLESGLHRSGTKDETLVEAVDQVADLIREVREFSNSLHPSVLDDF